MGRGSWFGIVSLWVSRERPPGSYQRPVAWLERRRRLKSGLPRELSWRAPSMRSLRNGSYARSAPLARFRISCRASLDLLRKSGEFPVSNEELDETATTVYEGF